MSSWRDNLRPASFRGVGFLFEDGDMAGGRRLQVNEYPQRDVPHVDDLGRKARALNITAFVIGDDYALKRDRLLAVLEQGGDGELVHPRLGTLKVYAGSYRYSETKDEGRMCRFTMEFTESGELKFPTGQTNFAATGALLNEDLMAAELADFESEFSLAGPEVVEQSAISRLTDLLKLAGQGFEMVQGLSADLAALIKTPSELVARIFAAFSPEALGLWQAGAGVFNQLSGLLSVSNKARAPLASLSPQAPSSQQTIARNTQALERLVRSAALAPVLEVASGLGSVVDAPVWQDVDQLRRDVIQVIDAEEAHPATGEVRRVVLSQVRANAVQGIREAQRQSLRLVEAMPLQVEPAVVTAYRLYGDALRGDEIVARNRITHPGFVPVLPLKVLEK